MSKFQIITLSVFGALSAVAVMIFTGAISLPGEQTQLSGNVTVWGSVPDDDIGELIVESPGDTNITADYEQINSDVFEEELIEALASGEGPDLFFITQDLLQKHRNKAYAIPSETYPIRTFQETFIEEASLFVDGQSVYALPVLIDPLVVYWNRDLFSLAGIAQMPRTWEAFFSVVPQLTQIDDSGAITQSAIGLGEYQNVNHAKDILALMMLQTDNNLIEKNTQGDYVTTLGRSVQGAQVNPGESALRFYTEFANPSTPRYSWNRSLPQSRTMFIQEDLAVYVGYASEREELLRQNPRLNLGMAPIPTVSGDARSQATFGKITAVMISRSTDNLSAAYYIASQMTRPEFLGPLEEETGLPPVRRDMLAAGTNDPQQSVLYESAVRARGWLDPNPEQTEIVFRDMIQGVTSGRFRPNEAILNAVRALEEIIRDEGINNG